MTQAAPKPSPIAPQNQIAKPRQANSYEMLVHNLDGNKTTYEKLRKILPAHMTPEKFCRVALTELNTNPALQCPIDVGTFMLALVECAQLGLEVGKLRGEAFLIPFANKHRDDGLKEVTRITGYHGLVKLALQSGDIKRIFAQPVFKDDIFEFEMGLYERLKHIPDPMGSRSDADIIWFYAVAVFKDGTKAFDVMSRKQVDAIRDRGRENKIWNSDYGEMGRKTMLRRLCKNLPKSPELADALALDTRADELLSLPPTNEPAKTRQIQAAAAQEVNVETRAREDDAERELILQAFDDAFDQCKERGGEPFVILGAPADWSSREAANVLLESFTKKLVEWKAP